MKFAEIARPLTNLTKGGVNFAWESEQEQAFCRLKDLLLSEPVLKLYNPNAFKTELHTDASAIGVAGMMLQADNENDDLKLVYAISRCTTEVEQKYHSSRLELMAIAWALDRLRSFLTGLKFVIYTDCQSLVHINAWQTKNSQIARWLSQLSEFDMEIKHRPGERMQHVDALSRAPVMSECEKGSQAEVLLIQGDEDEVLLFQRTDSEILERIDILKKNEAKRTKCEKGKVNDFVLRDGLLYKKVKREGKEFQLFVVPKAMRKALVIRYHDLRSHFGVDKTIKSIEKFYYFAGLKRYVRHHVSMCLECILAKRKVGPGAGELHSIPPGSGPFEIVHADHLGPFPASAGYTHILILIDNLTKFAYLAPVKSVKTAPTIKVFAEFIDLYGSPLRLITDRGTFFTSHSFQEFCLKYGMNHTLNSSRHAQANGLVERVNQTVLPLIKISTHGGSVGSWHQHLKKIARDINASVSVATGKTPFESLLGYLLRFEEGTSRSLTSHLETYVPPAEIQKEICAQIEEEQARYKEQYDDNRYVEVTLNMGDIVFMTPPPVATGESKKLQYLLGCPYVVVGVIPSDTYRIKRLNESNDRGYETTAHISQLKIWNCHKEFSENDSVYASDEENSLENDNCNNLEKDDNLENLDEDCNASNIVNDESKKNEKKIEKERILPKTSTRGVKPKCYDEYV